MKKFIYILFLAFFIQPAFAQDDQPGGKLREKMVEYIQNKLGLDKAQAEKFQPVFLEYFKERHRTNKEFKTDPLILQQKTVELRLRYREQFKTIVGEKRSNEVFDHERDFIQEVKGTLKDRQTENKQERQERRADRKNSKLLSN